MTANDTIAISLRLLRSPRAPIMAAVVLSIGVGALAAAFAIVDAVLLRPLPYRASEQLIRIWDAASPPGVDVLGLNDIDALDVSEPLVGVAGFAGVTQTLETPTAALTAEGQRVTVGLLDLLGARPSRGRLFLPEDDRLGAEPTVIVNPGVASALSVTVGDTILMDGQPHRLVGIMPREFWFPDRASNFWLPIVRVPAMLLGAASSSQQVRAIGRLANGVTRESAAGVLEAVISARTNRATELRLQALEDQMSASVRTPITLLLISAVLVTILTCLNAAWLFRVHARRSVQPFAVMAAVGASVREMAGILVAQGALVTVVVVPISLTIAQLLLVLASRAENGVLTRFGAPDFNGRVVALTASAAVLAVLVSCIAGFAALLRDFSGVGHLRTGLLPSQARRPLSLSLALQAAVVFAVAVQAVVLVIVLRSIFAVNVGFRETRLLGVHVKPTLALSSSSLAMQYQELSRQLSDVGIAGAVTSVAPLTGVEHLTSVRTPDQSPRDQTMVRARAISPTFFDLSGLALLDGRLPTVDDGQIASLIVDRPFANRVLHAGTAVGQRVILGDAVWQVAAVVSQVQHVSLFEEPQPTAYILYRDVPRLLGQTADALTKEAVILTAENGSVQSMFRRTEDIVQSALPGAVVTERWRFADLIWRAAGERPLMTISATAFAAIATLLLGLGLNGMLVEHVESRRREMALRASLGASPRRIVSEMLLPVCASCGLAVAGGGLLAALFTNTLLGLAFAPGDRVHVQSWLVAMVSTIVLAATVALAIWYPTSRALQLNPADALRVQD